jgi:hypothetical protein
MLLTKHQPSILVLAKTVDDVCEAVRYANLHGLKIAVQATGHGQPKECIGGMLIVTSLMRGVAIDPKTATARVQGGAMWSDVITPAFEFGLAPLSGSSPDVGVVGYLLGGGIGITMRTFGLGIDSIRSAQMVTANGELIRTSPTENADLFWALKGGGGAFGIVTEIEVALVPCAMLFGGSMMFPADRAEEVLCAYALWTRDLPCEATVCATIMNFPPVPFVPEFLHGKSFVILMGAICSPEEEARAIIKPMMDLGPMTSDFGMIPYTASAMIHKDPVDPLPATGQGTLLKELTPETVRTLLDAIGDIPTSPNLKIDIRHIGNRSGSAPVTCSSLDGLRDANYLLFCLGAPIGPITLEAMAAQIDRIFAALEPVRYGGSFLNWSGETNVPASRIEKCYSPDDLSKIRQIKDSVDPNNVFDCAGVGIR